MSLGGAVGGVMLGLLWLLRAESKCYATTVVLCAVCSELVWGMVVCRMSHLAYRRGPPE